MTYSFHPEAQTDLNRPNLPFVETEKTEIS